MDIEVNNIINKITNIVLETLNEKVFGIYYFGSGVMSGLKKDSDLDFLVVTHSELTKTEKRDLIDNLLLISGKIGNKENKRYLEVIFIDKNNLISYSYPLEAQLIYGEWLREKFEKAYIPDCIVSPDLTILLAQLLKKYLIISGEDINKIIDEVPFKDVLKAINDSLDEIVSEYKTDTRNVILTLCRMYTTVFTQQLVSKDKAAEYVITHIPKQEQRVIEYALSGYLHQIDDSFIYNMNEVITIVNFLKNEIKNKINKG